MYRDEVKCNACSMTFKFYSKDKPSIDVDLAYLEWAQMITDHVIECYGLRQVKWLSEKKGVG